MAVWNEEEVIHYPLTFIKSMPQITEVCIVVDEECTDETLGIVEDFDMGDKKKCIRVRYFDSFDKQKNAALEIATQDWVLWIDGDEAYTLATGTLFADLPKLGEVNTIHIPTIMMTSQDTRQGNYDLDPHIRLWKNRYVKYVGELHETPISPLGENLHVKVDISTYNYPQYTDSYMKHYTFLKSDKALREKAKRWNKITQVHWDEDYWVKAKYLAAQYAVPLEAKYV
jgi:glycosyltransferase involved in cell wall biosynthesis